MTSEFLSVASSLFCNNILSIILADGGLPRVKTILSLLFELATFSGDFLSTFLAAVFKTGKLKFCVDFDTAVGKLRRWRFSSLVTESGVEGGLLARFTLESNRLTGLAGAEADFGSLCLGDRDAGVDDAEVFKSRL